MPNLTQFRMEYLSTSKVQRALRRLDELAEGAGLVLELALCFGTVITLAYPSPELPEAPARLIEPSSRSDALVAQVTVEQKLPPDWVREDVKYFLSLFAAHHRTDVDIFGPNLLLCVTDPGHLLAMKLHACDCSFPPEDADVKDVRFLIENMGLGSWNAVLSCYERFMPGCSLRDEVSALFTTLFARPNGSAPLGYTPTA